MTLTETLRAFERLIERHLRSAQMEARIPQLRRSLQEDDFAEITGFMPDELHDRALAELEHLFDNRGRRRDLLIAESGNTPRRYTSLDRDALAEGSTVIPAVFRSPALYDYLEAITGAPVHPVPYVPEEFIAARLHKAGDVHGWHWDDYTWALVWIFKMPHVDNGGSLKYVRRVPWNRADPQVDALVARGPLLTRHPSVGSAYLLKVDTALHRVRPLRYDAERMIVRYTFATSDDLTRPVSHDSMAALYPESHERHNG